MKSRTLVHAAGTVAVLLHSIVDSASAQNCYYPNGDVARTDGSCSKDGGACCPLGWDCLSNGLCFLANEQYYGRYTCTDRSWGDDCPQYCTSNNTAAGNEAIAQCSDGSWCCDKNRDPQKPDCCSWDDKEVIAVPRGTTVTSITSTPRAPSSVPPLTQPTAIPTMSDRPTTTAPSPPSITSPTAATVTTRSTSSDSTGGISIITSILTTQPALGPTATESSHGDPQYGGPHGPPNNGVVIGVSVGVSVGVIAFFLALWIFWRRRQKKWAAQRSPPTSDYPNNHMSFMYNHGKHAHEIDSFPIADVGGGGSAEAAAAGGGGGGGGGGGRDKSRPISELTGSNHFMPGSPVSSMHTTSISPPGYSPTVTGSSANFPGTGVGVMGPGWSNSPTLPGVQEQPEPQELPPEGNPPRGADRQYLPVALFGQQQQKAQLENPQERSTEMTQNSGNGNIPFVYEPYRSYYHQNHQDHHGQETGQGAQEVTPRVPAKVEAEDPFTTSQAGGLKVEGQGGCGDGGAGGVLRTMSPDPLQPIQGGLRVVN